MKYFITVFIIAFDLSAAAQSPSLTINVQMDSLTQSSVRYKIEMKICDPKNRTQRGNWFSHDTSKIDFTSLKASEVNCSEYSDKGMPELISGEAEEIPRNSYKFSNQVFAWEKLFIFRISNISSRGRTPGMFIVLPMKYKSFRTSVDLSDIEFQPGKVIFLTEPHAVYDESVLVIRQSLKGIKAVDEKDFPSKGLL